MGERSSCMNDTKGTRMDGTLTLANCVSHSHYRLPWLRIRRTEVPGSSQVPRPLPGFSCSPLFSTLRKQPWQLSQSAHPAHLTRPVTPHWWCILRPSLQPAVGNKRRPQTTQQPKSQGSKKDPKTFRPQRNVLVAFIILTLFPIGGIGAQEPWRINTHTNP